MIEILICILIYLGGFFMLTSALGLVVFPDLFTRMQASTKASSLAAGCFLAAVMLHFQTWDVVVRALATLFFVFITAPVGAHILARGAYERRLPLWGKIKVDELKPYLEALKKKNDPAPKEKALSSKSVPSHSVGNVKISEIFKNLRNKKI